MRSVRAHPRIDDRSPDELLALVIEVIADGLPYEDAQVVELLDHGRE